MIATGGLSLLRRSTGGGAGWIERCEPFVAQLTKKPGETCPRLNRW